MNEAFHLMKGKLLKINNRKELYDYLSKVDVSEKQETGMSSVYFLVTYNGKTEPLYFMPYEGSYFESVCELHQFEMREDELEQLVKELYLPEAYEKALDFEKTMFIDGIRYEINNPQCVPFLPEVIDDIKPISETECVKWILQNWK